MKAAIATIQSPNYGNRLQNYALQTILTAEGLTVESLRREPFGIIEKAKRYLRGVLKHDALTRFAAFDDANINLSDCVLSPEFTSPDLGEAYDVFAIGSDQVWNPNFSFNGESNYLPTVEGAKKVAYAASFGVSSIAEDRERIAELINDIPSVSVREEAGAKIVKDLTGRDVPVVLDPTMLVDTAEWAKIAVKPRSVDCDLPYVFKCVFGNDVSSGSIEKIAQTYGCQIIDAQDGSLQIGPAEFVWLISHCELACTDSFHASVFSLLFHRPLAIFERTDANVDMSSRFDTLCSTFDLMGHRSSEDSFGIDAIYNTDWPAFEECLAEQKASSLDWLRAALAKAGGDSGRTA